MGREPHPALGRIPAMRLPVFGPSGATCKISSASGYDSRSCSAHGRRKSELRHTRDSPISMNSRLQAASGAAHGPHGTFPLALPS